MSTAYSQPRYNTRPEGALIPHRASPMVEIALVATPFVAILFQILLGPLTPLLVFLTGVVFVILRWERLYSIFAGCWPLLLLPAFCLVSFFWSDNPAYTARYGTLYLACVLVSVFLGAGTERLSLLKGTFLAFAIYMVLSLLLGRSTYVFGSGQAFVGLLGSKNASGDVGALTVLTSASVFMWALGLRRYVWMALSAVVLAMGAYTLWKSLATGALIATIVTLPCLVAWVISRRFDLRVRTSVFAVAAMTLIIMIATLDFWLTPLFDLVLENSGKDKGLTGRDVIWAKADELIAARPWFGQGYKSFWVHNNLDAEFIWRYMGISNRSGFNFHHTPREILVALGFVGLALFALVSLFSIFKLFTRTMHDPSYTGIFCCTLVVFESPRIFFEVIGFTDMHFGTLIVFMLFAFGLRPKTLPSLRRAD